ncbi:MAG: PilZ domain-containing protein [Myxococcales bacterium]|nr:MAG: PilZ domain-containing protein [Myxococcales bacterium]
MASIVLTASNRQVLRRAVNVPCQVVSDAQFELLGQRTLDLSIEGMQVETDKYVAPGEQLVVSFKSPVGNLWFDAEAEVVRTIHGYRRSDEGRAIAIRFKYFDRVSKHLLSTRLEGFAPPVPKRRLRPDYAASVQGIFYAKSQLHAMS